MKKYLLLPLILIACSKGNEPMPVTPKPVIIKTYTLFVKSPDPTTNLYVSGIMQAGIKDALIVKKGDWIQVANYGNDIWSLTDKISEGFVSVQVLLDDNVIYEVNCNCDAQLFKKI